MKSEVGKSMEGLNHRRNTEKEETTQTQSVAPNTGEEGMSSASTQSTKTSDIHNESINKQMQAKAHETAQIGKFKNRSKKFI